MACVEFALEFHVSCKAKAYLPSALEANAIKDKFLHLPEFPPSPGKCKPEACSVSEKLLASQQAFLSEDARCDGEEDSASQSQRATPGSALEEGVNTPGNAPEDGVNSNDEKWSWRSHKRQNVIDELKKRDGYQSAKAEGRSRTPDPQDRSVSKRQWETQVREWKHACGIAKSKDERSSDLAASTNEYDLRHNVLSQESSPSVEPQSEACGVSEKFLVSVSQLQPCSPKGTKRTDCFARSQDEDSCDLVANVIDDDLLHNRLSPELPSSPVKSQSEVCCVGEQLSTSVPKGASWADVCEDDDNNNNSELERACGILQSSDERSFDLAVNVIDDDLLPTMLSSELPPSPMKSKLEASSVLEERLSSVSPLQPFLPKGAKWGDVLDNDGYDIASQPRVATQGSTPEEVEWEKKSEKNQRAIDNLKKREGYQSAKADGRSRTPDPRDRSLSKRTWETQVFQWKHACGIAES